MSEEVVGQMVVLAWRTDEGENTDWQYLVVDQIYDDYIQYVKEYGGRYFYVDNKEGNETEEKVLSNQPTKSMLYPLYKDGKPVISKKNLFGKYTFKPKTK